MRAIVFVLCIFFCFSFETNLHEFHLSKSTINFDEESSTLQVTMHLFIDDLEDALAALSIPKLYIGTEKEDITADFHISAYINDKFNVTTQNDTLTQVFLGKELSEDLAAIWCYLEMPVENFSGELTIYNSVLIEVFEDQKNIVSIKRNKKRIDDLFLAKKNYTAQVDLF